MEGVSGQATGAVARACRIMWTVWTERSLGTFWPFGSVCSSRHYRRSSLYYSAVTVLPLLESKCIPHRSRDFRSLSGPSRQSPGWGNSPRFSLGSNPSVSGRKAALNTNSFRTFFGLKLVSGELPGATVLLVTIISIWVYTPRDG